MSETKHRKFIFNEENTQSILDLVIAKLDGIPVTDITSAQVAMVFNPDTGMLEADIFYGTKE